MNILLENLQLTNVQMIKWGIITAFSGIVIFILPLPGFIAGLALVFIGLGLSPVFPAMLHETPVRFGKENSQILIGFQMGFAYMGSAYSKNVLDADNPRVGLLSIGSEPTKGNELTKDTHKLLEKSPLNFIGNVESKDIFKGDADVVVADGFVGNIFLKTTEGLAEVVLKMVKSEIMSNYS